MRCERRARRLQVLRRLHAGALAAARAAAEAQHQAAGGEGEQEEGYSDGGPEPEPEGRPCYAVSSGHRVNTVNTQLGAAEDVSLSSVANRYTPQSVSAHLGAGARRRP